jgi:hypothetical protein
MRLAAAAMLVATLAYAFNVVLPWQPHVCPHHLAIAANMAAEADAHAGHHAHGHHVEPSASPVHAGPADHAGHAGHADPVNPAGHAQHNHHASAHAMAHGGHAAHGEQPGLAAPCFGRGGGHGDSEVPCSCDGRQPGVTALPASLVLLPVKPVVLAIMPPSRPEPALPTTDLPRRPVPPHFLPLAQAPPTAG